jgi:hypothetical protein
MSREMGEHSGRRGAHCWAVGRLLKILMWGSGAESERRYDARCVSVTPRSFEIGCSLVNRDSPSTPEVMTLSPVVFEEENDLEKQVQVQGTGLKTKFCDELEYSAREASKFINKQVMQEKTTHSSLKGRKKAYEYANPF